MTGVIRVRRGWTLAVATLVLSACAEDRVVEPPTPLVAPADVQVSVTGVRARVSWAGVTGATAYDVVLTAASEADRHQVVPASATLAAFDGLTLGVTYAAVVSAKRADETVAAPAMSFRVPDPVGDQIKAIGEQLRTGVHGTAKGMGYWYNRPDGYGAQIGVQYSTLACGGCHVYNEALTGVSSTTPCLACHPAAAGSASTPNYEQVDEAKCLKCHSRQGAEVTMGLPDVHRSAGMKCVNCHTAEQIHGGSTANTMFDVLDVKCASCHQSGGGAPVAPATSAHTVHGDKLACQTCHMSGSVTCYNCHFDDEINKKVKTAYARYADWVFLGNYKNQVYPLNFQSVHYQGKTFNAWGPFHGHTITETGRSCNACHGADNVIRIANGTAAITQFDPGTKTMSHMKGIIPVPADYTSRFQFDYVTKDAGGAWIFVETGPDASHMLYATPLTASQMNKLVERH